MGYITDFTIERMNELKSKIDKKEVFTEEEDLFFRENLIDLCQYYELIADIWRDCANLFLYKENNN